MMTVAKRVTFKLRDLLVVNRIIVLDVFLGVDRYDSRFDSSGAIRTFPALHTLTYCSQGCCKRVSEKCKIFLLFVGLIEL